MNAKLKLVSHRFLGLLLVASFALGAWACGKSLGAEKEKAEQKKTVRVTRIGRMDIEHVLRYVADLKPYSEVNFLAGARSHPAFSLG